jgi:subtilisin family serine protease
MQPGATYIMLPIEAACEIDRRRAASDFTSPEDGWGVFSGTSAAAPQLAGVCALLLQKNPGLTPNDIKAVLRRTSRDVVNGAANAASNEGNALTAGSGTDSATGTGLVDAFAAWQQA